MSWFAGDSSTAASSVVTSADHCDYSNKRLCTAAEVCPTSPGGQSVAGVTGESLNKALLVVGGTFLDAATCQRLAQTTGYNVDGFLCCPSDRESLPSPKDFISDGKCQPWSNVKKEKYFKYRVFIFNVQILILYQFSADLLNNILVKSASSQVAHQAVAHPGLSSMKRLEVFLLFP